MSEDAPAAASASPPEPSRHGPRVDRTHDDKGFLIRGAQPTRVEAFVDAAFAFAVTLLVVSVGSVPGSVEELINAMRGVPAFAASFIIIALIWQEHRQWSQRFGLEDGYTIRLSLALVFIVLLYVYPLRMMFTMAFGGMSGGLLMEHAVTIQGADEVRALYIIYAVGYGLVALILAQLNRYALRRADALDLSARERVHTQTVIRIWWIMAVMALLSLLLALLLPLGAYSGLLAALPGVIYVLIWPAEMVAMRRGRAKLSRLQQEEK